MRKRHLIEAMVGLLVGILGFFVLGGHLPVRASHEAQGHRACMMRKLEGVRPGDVLKLKGERFILVYSPATSSDFLCYRENGSGEMARLACQMWEYAPEVRRIYRRGEPGYQRALLRFAKQMTKRR